MTGLTIGDALAESIVYSLSDDFADAAVVARTLLRAGSGRPIDRRTLSVVENRALERITADFASRNWVVDEGGGRIMATSSLPLCLPDFLDGAAAFQRVAPADGRATAVVTMPAAPSSIARILPTLGVGHAALEPTASALDRIASAATGAFTIMTPFLNEEGVAPTLAVFEASPAPLRKLIVRMRGPTAQVVRRALARFEAAKVDVLDYALPNRGGYETFHAKVVIADREIAYVGSANMTVFARHSMELGVVVEGRAARVVASLVRGVERVAVPVESR